jgi:hypothetical protein
MDDMAAYSARRYAQRRRMVLVGIDAQQQASEWLAEHHDDPDVDPARVALAREMLGTASEAA